MNTTIWILQGLMAFVFLASGIAKAVLDEEQLLKNGQTGIEGLHKWFIKFIGISELLGAAGLLLPMWLQTAEFLTPLAAMCLGAIMFPAAMIHYKRKEYLPIAINAFVLLACAAIVYFRWPAS